MISVSNPERSQRLSDHEITFLRCYIAAKITLSFIIVEKACGDICTIAMSCIRVVIVQDGLLNLILSSTVPCKPIMKKRNKSLGYRKLYVYILLRH